MGKTTIEVDEAVRDRLRAYKDSHGMTYDGAIDRLLTTVGEPVPTDGNANSFRERGGTIYESDIITPPETAGMCAFHEHFMGYNYQPVVFGVDREADPTWEDFRAALTGLHQYLPNDVTRTSFSIHQYDKAWYGYGLESFIEALETREARYEQAALEDPHHSETAVYLCITEWGTVCIGLQASSKRANHLTIRFLTDGVPLTPHPYAAMAQQIDRDLSTAHNLDIESATVTDRRELKDTEIVDTITRDPDRYDGPIVRGLIIQNPFYDNLTKLRRVTDKSDYFKEITTYEHIPCYLAGHHPAGETHDYELKEFTLHSNFNLTSGFSFINVECRGDTLYN